MLHIRTTKTSSGSTAVQIVKYIQRKMNVLIHIGSAKNEDELIRLKDSASQSVIFKIIETISPALNKFHL